MASQCLRIFGTIYRATRDMVDDVAHARQIGGTLLPELGKFSATTQALSVLQSTMTADAVIRMFLCENEEGCKCSFSILHRYYPTWNHA